MASPPTRPRTRRSRRSTPPRSGPRSTRSSPMFWTSTARGSTRSLAPRPKRWPAHSGLGLSLWSCPWLRPARISLLARAGLDTVAIRSPSHETARALIEAAGVPLAAPSANRSGAVSPTTAAHVVADLDGRVDWILDGGPCRHGLEIDDRRVSRRSAPIAASGRDNPGGDRIRARFADRLDEHRGNRPERARAIGVALCAQRLRFDSARRAPRRTKPRSISAARSRAARRARDSIFRRPADLVEAASHLFSYLRALDGAGAARIAVAPIPEHGLGAAINDRLRRAAASERLNDGQHPILRIRRGLGK